MNALIMALTLIQSINFEPGEPTSQIIGKLREGMSQSEAIHILGDPVTIHKTEWMGSVSYSYSYVGEPCAFKDFGCYFVVESGKVTQIEHFKGKYQE